MKSLNTPIMASVLYILFFLSIDSKFAAEFRQYLLED